MRRVILLLFILIVAYIAYPYLTLYRLDRALLTNDQTALTRVVDFPSVRADLKSEVQGQVFGKADEFAEKRPILGAFGQALAGLFASDLVGGAVDSVVTPEAILNSDIVVEHQRNDKSFAPFVTYAFFSGPTTFTFDLKDPEKPDSPTLTAIMELTGFRWRVVAIKLPPVGSWFANGPE